MTFAAKVSATAVLVNPVSPRSPSKVPNVALPAACTINEAPAAPYSAAMIDNWAGSVMSHRGDTSSVPYSAAKGALERWGESMACEIAPFGLGVTVLVAGTFDTEIITDAGTTDDRNFDGPYARLHNTMNTRGRFAIKFARPPERFTDGLLKALADRKPFRRRGVGADSSMLLVSNRMLPAIGMHHMSRIFLGIPKQRSMRGGAWPLTVGQRAMVVVARVLPEPVLQRLASLAAKRRKGNQGTDGH